MVDRTICSVVFGSYCFPSRIRYKSPVEMIYYPEDPRFYLKNELEARTKRRPHYSLRAFARDMELSPSTLSDFLNNKIGFSKQRVFQIGKKLLLSQNQVEHWWDLIEAKHARDPELRRLARVRVKARVLNSKNRLALEQFQFISEWQHMAILELIEMSPKYHAADAIAVALKIPIKIVSESIARLQKLSMIHINEAGAWTVSSTATLVDDVTSNKAVKSYHAQILQKVESAIETQNTEKRESQSIIFGVPQESIQDLKTELQNSLVNIIMKYTKGENKDAVYCLSAHLFSLTNQENK